MYQGLRSLCFVLAAIAVIALVLPASAVTVSSFAPFSLTPTAGEWLKWDVRFGGTAAVVDLTGAGGDLENNQPLPIGAARLTTRVGENPDKAEVGVFNSYGTFTDIVSGIEMGYDYHKATVVGGAPAPAPSMKLGIFDSVDGKLSYLIFEPYLNATGGGIADPTPDLWTRVDIDADTGSGVLTSGGWWWSGGLGIGSSFAGPPYRSLNEWGAAFLGAGAQGYSTAQLIYVGMGVGSFNPGQVGYFDNVLINAGSVDETYDFELAADPAIPEPISAGLGSLALLALTGYATRRRR